MYKRWPTDPMYEKYTRYLINNKEEEEDEDDGRVPLINPVSFMKIPTETTPITQYLGKPGVKFGKTVVAFLKKRDKNAIILDIRNIDAVSWSANIYYNDVVGPKAVYEYHDGKWTIRSISGNFNGYLMLFNITNIAN